MMARLLRLLGALPPRQLHLLGVGLLLILAAGLWTFALRAPLAALRVVQAERQRLETGSADPRLLAAQLAQVDGAIQTLSARLGLNAVHPAPAQMLVALVGDVNRLALAHGINVTAVTPAPDGQTLVFDQIGFEAQATGSYTALLAWMAAIEAAQANIAIVAFEMAPAKTAGQIHMTIRIAAYRPQEGTP
jgi:Tfp pilus assembly protein PilO